MKKRNIFRIVLLTLFLLTVFSEAAAAETVEDRIVVLDTEHYSEAEIVDFAGKYELEPLLGSYYFADESVAPVLADHPMVL